MPTTNPFTESAPWVFAEAALQTHATQVCDDFLPPRTWERAIASKDNLNCEIEQDLRMLWRELDDEAEHYYRAHEEGWFYPDTD